MNDKLKNLIVRAITGFVFIITILLGITYNVFSANLLLGIILIIGTNELTKAINKKREVFKTISVLIAFLIYDAVVLSIQFNNELLLYSIPILISTPLLIELFSSKKSKNSIEKLGNSYLSIIYPLFGIIGMYFIIFNKTNNDIIFQPLYMITIFVAIWLNDTFAYLTGMIFGKTKLFERVSPNKTWEGTIGGIIISVVLTLIFVNQFIASNINNFEWLIIILTTVIAGNLGDLIESLLKRNLKIKDSGNILPGHGGILDRFDSIFFAAPFAALMFKIIDYL